MDSYAGGCCLIVKARGVQRRTRAGARMSPGSCSAERKIKTAPLISAPVSTGRILLRVARDTTKHSKARLIDLE
jgi:hypothetical protein